MKYQASVVLPVPAEEYFLLKDSAAFMSLMAKLQQLKCIRFQGLVPSDAPDTDVLWMVTEPDMSAYVPPSLSKWVALDPEVHDLMTYQRERVAGPSYSFDVSSTVSTMGDKFKNNYTISIEPLSDASCRQSISGEVNISMRLIGSTAEKITAESIEKGYKNMSQVIERWIEVRNSMMATEEGRQALMDGTPTLSVIPQDALAALQRPYEDVRGHHEFEGDVFFDPEELSALELPPDLGASTIAALVGDSLALLQATEREPPSPEEALGHALHEQASVSLSPSA